MTSYVLESSYTLGYIMLMVLIFWILNREREKRQRENYQGLAEYILISIAILGTVMNWVLAMLLVEAHIWLDILGLYQIGYLENIWILIFLTFPFTICALIWAYGRSHMVVERLP